MSRLDNINLQRNKIIQFKISHIQFKSWASHTISRAYAVWSNTNPVTCYNFF